MRCVQHWFLSGRWVWSVNDCSWESKDRSSWDFSQNFHTKESCLDLLWSRRVKFHLKFWVAKEDFIPCFAWKPHLGGHTVRVPSDGKSEVSVVLECPSSTVTETLFAADNISDCDQMGNFKRAGFWSLSSGFESAVTTNQLTDRNCAGCWTIRKICNLPSVATGGENRSSPQSGVCFRRDKPCTEDANQSKRCCARS